MGKWAMPRSDTPSIINYLLDLGDTGKYGSYQRLPPSTTSLFNDEGLRMINALVLQSCTLNTVQYNSSRHNSDTAYPAN
jgi:hypothetical protein